MSCTKINESTQTVWLLVAMVAESRTHVASKAGGKLYEKIAEALEDDKHVVLSFKGVALMTVSFLEAFLVPLYEKYGAEKIGASMKAVDTDPYQKQLIKNVVCLIKKNLQKQTVLESKAG